MELAVLLALYLGLLLLAAAALLGGCPRSAAGALGGAARVGPGGRPRGLEGGSEGTGGV